MTDVIEIKLPGKPPTTVFPHALISIVFQESSEGSARKDALIIGIQGWAKPYLYEADDAFDAYKKLLGLFRMTRLEM